MVTVFLFVCCAVRCQCHLYYMYIFCCVRSSNHSEFSPVSLNQSLHLMLSSCVRAKIVTRKLPKRRESRDEIDTNVPGNHYVA